MGSKRVSNSFRYARCCVCQPGFLVCGGGKSHITATKNRLILTNENPVDGIEIDSSWLWEIVGDTNVAYVDRTTGFRGRTKIQFTKSEIQGIEVVEFYNKCSGQIVSIEIISVDQIEWVLDNGYWKALGFWFADSTWK